MYSTTTNIRDEAGFTGNTNITDVKITSYQNAAFSHINGIISRVYTLPLSETPNILELIERKLSAGHLMLDEYGEEAEGTDKDGQAKIDWAESQLKMIEEGYIQLIGADSAVLSQNNAIGMSGKPDDSTADEDNSDDPHVFKSTDQF